MKCKKCFFSSSIGKKTLMAITGLMLIGFLITHLMGNFLLFDFFGGQEAYNNYSHTLSSNPLIYGAELFLFSLIFFHICSAIFVTLVNYRARPKSYAKRINLKKSTFSSRTMVHTGGIIFIFIILHLMTFKFGNEYYFCADKKNCHPCLIGKDTSTITTKSFYSLFSFYVDDSLFCKKTRNGSNSEANLLHCLSKKIKNDRIQVDQQAYCGREGVTRDIYRTVIECFKNQYYSIFYLICILVLGVHLNHGFFSAFQTLGFNHPRYNNKLKKICTIIAFLITIGYLIFPIFFGIIKGAL